MKILLADVENDPKIWIELLSCLKIYDKVVTAYGRNSGLRIPANDLNELHEYMCKGRLIIAICNTAPSGADICLGIEAGRLLERHPKAIFFIRSKDKGLIDSGYNYLKDIGCQVEIVADSQLPDKYTNEVIMACHRFSKKDPAVTLIALKNSLHSITNLSESGVTDLIAVLVKYGIIKLVTKPDRVYIEYSKEKIQEVINGK